ncbi:MAG TPA: response regulator transcription factor [Gaiellaceae bacterium]|jgi:DNA-binding NarL/FixJ family response regulator
MAVRVLVIEDNEVFRNALEVLLTLDGDIEIAGSEPDGNDVVERCRELQPHVALVDYRLPGLDGVQVTRLLRRHAPGVAVVALTAAAGEREVEALLAAGAVSCLGKDRPLDEIVEAVRNAASLEATG